MAASEAEQTTKDVSEAEEEETVCVASPADREAVLAIDSGHGDQDALADTYLARVQGTGVTGYLLKKKGKVVSIITGGFMFVVWYRTSTHMSV